jgi:plastocyanin
MKLLVFILAMTAPLEGAQPIESGTARVSVLSAHLRKGPTIGSEIVTTLPKGTLLSVLGRQNRWVEVRVANSGVEGFIFDLLIEPVAEPSPSVPPSPSPSPSPLEPGTISGRVSMVVRGGGRAEDLSDAVVYLENAPGAPPVGAANIEMRGKEFIPHVLVVGVGSRVDFPNLDPILHNVFSPSSAEVFDLGLYMRPDRGGWVFRHPGLVRVYCNIHPQMSAVVAVRDNPYFTKPSANGNFTIPRVPPGRYTLKAWQDDAEKEQTTTVVVPSGGKVSVALVLDASGFEQQPHKKKDGKDYAPDAYRQ